MPAECTNLTATVDVKVSDVGCVVLVSEYDVDVVVSGKESITWEQLVKHVGFMPGVKK